MRISKEIALEANSDTLDISYLLENIPRDRPLHFAIEFNFAGMAAGADDRYFYYESKPRGRPVADAAAAFHGYQESASSMNGSASTSRSRSPAAAASGPSRSRR